MGLVGSVLKKALGRETLHRDILADPVGIDGGMAGGLNALDVDFGEFFDMLHDPGELGAKAFHFLVAQINAREVGNVTDVDLVVGHAPRMYRSRSGWNRKDQLEGKNVAGERWLSIL